HLAGVVTYSYEGVAPTAYVASTVPPSAAGTYTVTATFPEQANYSQLVSAPVVFTIAKAAGAFGTPDELSATYTPTLTQANSAPPADDVWDAPATPVVAGNNQEFDATYTHPSGNYEAAKGKITVHVAKAAGAGTVALAGWVYGATPSALVPTTATHLAGVVTYSYEGVAPTAYVASTVPPSAAGTYTVTATFPEQANYSRLVSAPVVFTIAKAAGAFGAPPALSATYTPTLTQANIAPPADYVWDAPATPVVAGNNQLFDATYTHPSGNYEAATGKLTVHVAKAPGEGSVSLAGWTFGEAANEIVLTSPTNSEDLSDLSSVTYAGIAPTSYGPSPTQPVAAGNYTVTVAFREAANYTAVVSAPAVFTISKVADPEKVLNFAFPKAADITYGALLAASALTGGSTQYGTFAWSAPATLPPAGAAVGYEVTFTPNLHFAANYAAIPPQNVPLTVHKAVGAGSVAIAGWVYGAYDAAANAPVPRTATHDVDALAYRYVGASNSGTAYGPSEDRPDSAGAYTVTAIFAETASYNALSVSAAFTIARAPAPAAPRTAAATYGETLADIAGQLPAGWAWAAEDPSAAAVGSVPGAYHPATYAEQGSYAAGLATVKVTIARRPIPVPQAHAGWVHDGTLKTGVAAGLGYTVGGENTAGGAGSYLATVKPDGNHQWVVGADPTLARSVAWAIAKAEGAGSVALAGWVYGAAANAPVPITATNNRNDVRYLYAGASTAGIAYGPSAAAPASAGSYTVTATFAATASYLEVVSDPYPFAITKADAPGAPDTVTLAATYGQTLADIAAHLPAGWAWEEEASTTLVGSVPGAYHPAAYAATANYAAGAASVWVAIARKPIPTPQANTGLVYDGEPKTGVDAGEGYIVGGENTAVATGHYTATVTPDGNHRWDKGDEPTAARSVAWSVAGLLDFLTYAVVKPSGELMMNLNRLKANGYHVAIYRWYKNGEQVSAPTETAVNVLTVGATYRFEIVTTSGATQVSTSYVHGTATAVGGEGYAPLRVYPNPAGEQLTIAGEQWKPGDMAEVYDLQGVLVAKQPIVGNLTTVDIARLPPGVYVVKVGGRAAKVVKQVKQ
ncbi:MAG: T9SS type A sorting domain-containing protein, partial [Prevotellaceae bacterium]|nr:T9SS type A sorting domain-containing protein [Prevotellaceae bacterium]